MILDRREISDMMFEERIKEMEQTLFETEQITLWEYSTDWELLYTNNPWAAELRNIFYLGDNIAKINEANEKGLKLTSVNDDFGLTWTAFLYNGEESVPKTYILGPILNTEISEQILREKMNTKEMSISSQLRFQKLSANIPVLPRSFFFHISTMFYYTLFRETYDIHRLFISPNFTQEQDLQESTIDTDHIHHRYHGSYAFETEFLHNVETGNIHYSDEYVSQQRLLDTGLMAPGNPRRQVMDEMIVSTALVTRAAMRGGLAPETAYNLSDYYIQRIESSKTTEELYLITGHMYDDFIHRVYQLKHRTGYSPAVEDSLAMIRSNVTKIIDIKAISAALGYACSLRRPTAAVPFLNGRFPKGNGRSFLLLSGC